MVKISNWYIKEQLDKANDVDKAIKGIESLLLSNGYENHSDENRLLFTKGKGVSLRTIDIDLRKYRTSECSTQDDSKKEKDENEQISSIGIEENSITTEEEKKEEEKIEKSSENPIEKESQNATMKYDDIHTPFQKALKYPKYIIFGITIIGVLAVLTGDRHVSEAISLIIRGIIYAAIPLFLIMWLIYYINDSWSTEEVKEKTKQTTEGILDTKAKPKDANDTADAILKYHDMLVKGIITQEEFDKIKKDLLSKNIQ